MPSSAAWCPSTIRSTRSASFPRGRALGVTMFLPEEDRYSHSKQRHRVSMICSLFGGRIAEELIAWVPMASPPARSNDIQRATDMARNMVTKWGLSERMGPLLYDEESRRCSSVAP
jgi:cell division protease FtsH